MPTQGPCRAAADEKCHAAMSARQVRCNRAEVDWNSSLYGNVGREGMQLLHGDRR